MPRKPREEVEGGIHDVFARGNNKHPLYRNDADRWLYLHLARLGRRACALALPRLLPDGQPRPFPDRDARGRISAAGCSGSTGGTAAGSTTATNDQGMCFQGQFSSQPATDDLQMWVTARYIAAQPGRGGAVPQGRGLAVEQPLDDGARVGAAVGRRGATAVVLRGRWRRSVGALQRARRGRVAAVSASGRSHGCGAFALRHLRSRRHARALGCSARGVRGHRGRRGDRAGSSHADTRLASGTAGAGNIRGARLWARGGHGRDGRFLNDLTSATARRRRCRTPTPTRPCASSPPPARS